MTNDEYRMIRIERNVRNVFMFLIDTGSNVSTVIRASHTIVYDRCHGFPGDLGTQVGAWRSK